MVEDLASLRFVQDAGNVLLDDGRPVSARRLLAVCLARRAAEAGQWVYFTTAAETSPPGRGAAGAAFLRAGLELEDAGPAALQVAPAAHDAGVLRQRVLEL